ncbi:hypothetical protein BBF96_05745 [Anoxybacter fermentans]|uniref:Prepilin type IV endopeptidase peptidase domain-containing protein n=1 Tax=Anoxybacter fermentans TaxID=1323375 RepID=A0A3S9SXG0_9FIRM|nr:prepilin peptidase [Anoxybacter fermentans]AZR72938.1 hypothetical protein BBF96_05745 [Anoxybacter fermentans]
MINDLGYLFLLGFLGIKDLKYRRIKHWQIFTFLVYILIQIVSRKYLTSFILINFLIVTFLGFIGYLIGRIGAADVKVIALSSLYNFYRYHPWWVWKAGILTGIIDLLLGALYYHPKGEATPLLFSWMLANLLFFILWLIQSPLS